MQEEDRGSDGKWATLLEVGWAGRQPSPACMLRAASISHKERPGEAHFQALTALHDSGEDKRMQNIGTAFVAALHCRQNRALGLGCKNKSPGIGCVFMPKPCFLQLNQTRFCFLISWLASAYPHHSVSCCLFETKAQEQSYHKGSCFNTSSLTWNRKYQKSCKKSVIFPAYFQASVVWRTSTGHFKRTASRLGVSPLPSRSLARRRYGLSGSLARSVGVQVLQAETKFTNAQRREWESLLGT